ncbi:MAG: hypothetical protein WCF85_07165 [Rhodospirillaceae bacterium]
MAAASVPPRLISLEDVVKRRFWCPFSGSRFMVPDGNFAVNSSCIGPRCAGWEWRSAGDALESEPQRCYLLPPHFNPDYRIRLASQTLPELVAPLQALARGEGDAVAVRESILAWAQANWQPEKDLVEPNSWQRLADVYWDKEADTVALDLVRNRTDEQRVGFCGLKQSSG